MHMEPGGEHMLPDPHPDVTPYWTPNVVCKLADHLVEYPVTRDAVDSTCSTSNIPSS